MNKKGLILFTIGIVCGLLGNYAARKLNNLHVFPDNWLQDDDLGDW